MISVREFPELQTLSLDDQYSILRRCRKRALLQILNSSMGVVLLLLLTLNLLLLTVTLSVWLFVVMVVAIVLLWLHHEVRNRMHHLVYVEVRVHRLMQRQQETSMPTWPSQLAADIGE